MTNSDAAARAFQGAVSQAAKQLEKRGAPDTFRLSAQTCDETAQDLREMLVGKLPSASSQLVVDRPFVCLLYTSPSPRDRG